MLKKLESLGGGPALFTGDFNSHKDNNNWEKYAVKHGLELAGKCAHWSIDQIYFTENHWEKLSETTGNHAGSDHKAFWVNVNFLGDFKDEVAISYPTTLRTTASSPTPPTQYDYMSRQAIE